MTFGYDVMRSRNGIVRYKNGVVTSGYGVMRFGNGIVTITGRYGVVRSRYVCCEI